MEYWLVKEEPGKYSFDDFLRDGTTDWTGVRNYQARNNLREMSPGDEVLYYHSGKEKQVMGLARVKRAAFPDPTAKDGDWSAVQLEALSPLERPVALKSAREDKVLKETLLVRHSRISVMPLTASQFRRFVTLGGGAGP